MKNAKPGQKVARLYDERGLYLEVTPTGAKYWRQKYRFAGKEKRLAHGVYPEVSLSKARELRDKARVLLAEGIDPSADKRERHGHAVVGTDTFEAVGRAWFEKNEAPWSSGHRDRVRRQLNKDLFPWIGKLPIAHVDAPTLLRCLERIEQRGAVNSAHKTRGVASDVFKFAISKGLVHANPARDIGAALKPAIGKHFPALTRPEDVARLLKAIDAVQGSFAVCCALKIAPLLFVRPGDLRKAKWVDIDLEQQRWEFTPSKNVRKSQYASTAVSLVVPLAAQAISILQELHPLTGAGDFVFPSERSSQRPMSENTLNAALRRVGISKDEHVAHGFRATARTLLDEELGYRPDWIEHQLGHVVKDPNGRAYNRTAYLSQRTEMMQRWADYLGALRNR